MINLDAEKEFFSLGYRAIAGVDEAGRGPLAGPVVAACVIIKPDFDFSQDWLSRIKDSKKINAKNRAELARKIKDNFLFGIGECDHVTIDRINILQASFLAMKKAISALKEKPDFALVDGKLEIPNFSLPQKAIINGDDLVFAISAASIIAKEERDRAMLRLHELYPQYSFDEHKGYGTKKHLAILNQFGPSPIHRKSFAPIKNMIK